MTSRLWFERALVGDTWANGVRCTIETGRIRRLEREVVPDPRDERHGIGLPGLANVHSHTFQRGMAGLSERRGPADDSFWTWRDTMYRFLERLTPDDVEVFAAQAFVEMLERGFTRVGEFHYLHHAPDGRPYAHLAEMAERIAAAAVTSGIGLTLLPCFYAYGGFGSAPPGPGQRRFLNDVDRFAALLDGSLAAVRSLPDANVGIAPHSLRAVGPDELAALLPLAAGRPVHIHVAEQVKEVERSIAWSGEPPVAWLLHHAPVDARWCLIHATHTTDAELLAIAARGAVVGLCPVSESSLGDGIFPAPMFQQAGGRWAIGTDSNICIDAASELRTLEYGQRLARRARNVLASGPGASTGRSLFDMAARAGAQALGQGTGRLQEGEPADLVSLDAADPALTGREGDAILDSWIFAGRASLVRDVWCHGCRVVADGRHLRRDHVEAAFRRTLTEILAR